MRFLLLLLLAGCVRPWDVQPVRTHERCIPVIVDGRQESCLTRRDFDEFLRDIERSNRP